MYIILVRNFVFVDYKFNLQPSYVFSAYEETGRNEEERTDKRVGRALVFNLFYSHKRPTHVMQKQVK